MPANHELELPEEKPLDRPPRWEPWATLVGALALAGLVNGVAVAYLDWRPVNLGYRVIKAKWRLLDAQRQPVDWLVLGDSSGNQGVDPAVLSSALGAPALNLCTIGALGPWNDAWMLEAYTRHVGPPRNVLAVHTYEAWTHSLNIEALAQIPRPGPLARLDPAPDLSAGETVFLFLQRYVPLYAQDVALSLLVRTPWRVIGRPFEIDTLGFARETQADPDAVRRDAAQHRVFVSKEPFAMSDLSRRALDTLARLADRNGIEIYLAGAPVYEGLWADSTYRAYWGAVQDALADVAARHPRLHLVGREPVTFPAEEMQNADHLVERAARRYASTLAERIRAQGRPAP